MGLRRMQIQNLNRENLDKTFRPYNVSDPTTIARHKSRGSKSTSDQDNNWWTYVISLCGRPLGRGVLTFRHVETGYIYGKYARNSLHFWYLTIE